MNFVLIIFAVVLICGAIGDTIGRFAGPRAEPQPEPERDPLIEQWKKQQAAKAY